MDLQADAESGCDFASRWYTDGRINGSLGDTGTNRVLPTDLKRTLASFHRILGDGDSAALSEQHAARRLEVMESVLWDAERGACFDFNLTPNTLSFPPPTWHLFGHRALLGLRWERRQSSI
ncbi:Trehalase [Liparis tanakae]|uniref:Trehalase n=1 Tax=Liparis tanakae TaxID=230148 RepID=A0A4Z2HLM8_9TELE|nr:Trehalase [Liparis tanakae]